MQTSGELRHLEHAKSKLGIADSSHTYTLSSAKAPKSLLNSTYLKNYLKRTDKKLSPYIANSVEPNNIEPWKTDEELISDLIEFYFPIECRVKAREKLVEVEQRDWWKRMQPFLNIVERYPVPVSADVEKVRSWEELVRAQIIRHELISDDDKGPMDCLIASYARLLGDNDSSEELQDQLKSVIRELFVLSKRHNL